ncbi:MAG: expansin EXLX1 family cellulose-binding protein [Thermoanaerobaculia bacterium]
MLRSRRMAPASRAVGLAWVAVAAIAGSAGRAAFAEGYPSCPAVWQDLDGVATYYDADGSGNCSFPAALDLMVTAVAAPDWQGSAQCGRCLRVWGPDASVVVRVVDQCPECPTGHLDLSAEAFDVIADPLDGIVPIAFRSIECPVTGNLSVAEKDGVNPWWFAVQIRNHRHAIATLELRENGSSTWQAMARQDYNYFLVTSGPGLATPLDFRITDVQGFQVVENDLVTTIVPSAVLTGTTQFPACDDLFLDGFETGTASPLWSSRSPW